MPSVITILSLLAKFMADETVQQAFAKLLDFIKGLSPAEQAAYLSKFTGYGAASPLGEAVADCPDCPDDCIYAEGLLMQAVSGVEVEPITKAA